MCFGRPWDSYFTTVNPRHNRLSAVPFLIYIIVYVELNVKYKTISGGVLIIGIEDNGEIRGFSNKDSKNINDFLNVPYTSCIGNMHISIEERDIIIGNHEDKLLIFFIDPSDESVVKTTDGKVYLRVGDKSKLLNHDQITQLEYDKGERKFEDIVEMDSSIEDVDMTLLEQYRNILKTKLSPEEVLEARGLMKKGHLTYAGILLFAKYPTKYLPNARLRLLKYDGTKMETGRRLNIVKEINFESAIPKII